MQPPCRLCLSVQVKAEKTLETLRSHTVPMVIQLLEDEDDEVADSDEVVHQMTITVKELLHTVPQTERPPKHTFTYLYPTPLIKLYNKLVYNTQVWVLHGRRRPTNRAGGVQVAAGLGIWFE